MEKEDLREFKNRPDVIGLVGSRARSLILWTERGAARHAKMLETDRAWEAFEKLEDSYFNQKEVLTAPPVYPPFSADYASRTELIYYRNFKPIFCRTLKEGEIVNTHESMMEYLKKRGLIFFTRDELRRLTLDDIRVLLTDCR